MIMSTSVHDCHFQTKNQVGHAWSQSQTEAFESLGPCNWPDISHLGLPEGPYVPLHGVKGHSCLNYGQMKQNKVAKKNLKMTSDNGWYGYTGSLRDPSTPPPPPKKKISSEFFWGDVRGIDKPFPDTYRMPSFDQKERMRSEIFFLAPPSVHKHDIFSTDQYEVSQPKPDLLMTKLGGKSVYLLSYYYYIS